MTSISVRGRPPVSAKQSVVSCQLSTGTGGQFEADDNTTGRSSERPYQDRFAGWIRLPATIGGGHRRVVHWTTLDVWISSGMVKRVRLVIRNADLTSPSLHERSLTRVVLFARTPAERVNDFATPG